MTALLADVTAAFDRLYPPALAEDWDAVGLVCGDPDAPVRRVLLAVDPVAATVAEALSGSFDLLVTHHPLHLRGTTSVAADHPKGRAVHDLIGGGCGLFVAHTNADKAVGGVNDALADLLGLQDIRPLVADSLLLDKLVVFVPVADADRVRDAVTAAGAGALGDYDECTWSTRGTGSFRPLDGSTPSLGEVGSRTQVEEVRLETVVLRDRRADVLAALQGAHPYQTPAYDLMALTVPAATGAGRVGDIEPMLLGDLLARVAARLPATVGPVRASGDPASVVRRVAVCGGAGGDLMEAAKAAGAQVLLTADLKHHTASEAPEGLALIDAAHWATEWPWLERAAQALTRLVEVEAVVSTLCTDPWTTSRSSGP